MPLSLVHSREDAIIPFRYSRRLFHAAREPKTFLEIVGGHNEGFMISGEVYLQGLAEFIGCLSWKNDPDGETPINSDQ